MAEDSTPVVVRGPMSDPSPLTTQQIQRETSALREMIEVRLTAIDKATALFETNLTRVPTEVDKQISHLKELMMSMFALQTEKFDSVQKQFVERDIRVEKTAEQTKVAVDAALQAAEKAVGKQNEASSQAIAKSEAATIKQIDQLGVLIAATNKASDEKTDDLKERMNRIESEGRGAKLNREDNRGMWGVLFGAAGLVLAVGAMILRAMGK